MSNKFKDKKAAKKAAKKFKKALKKGPKSTKVLRSDVPPSSPFSS